MYRLGLASIAFRHLLPEQIVALAKQAGLSYIEWGSDVHAPKDDLPALDRIAAMTAEAGLHISSYGTYFRIDRDAPEEILGYIRAAKRLGTETLRIWCVGNPKDLTQEELLQRYAVCRKLAELAEREGVVLCAECHSGNLTDNADSSLALMQAVNSPALRMYWQPNDYCSFESNLAFAGSVAEYVKNVHVFNWDKHVRYPLAEAKEEWQQYIRALGEEHIYLLEHMPDENEALLPGEAEALAGIIKGIT